MEKLTVVAIATALCSAASGFAQSNASQAATLQVVQASPTTAPMVDGEVRKIDKEAGKITIKHGPLANLDMPSMTMVFRVKDPAMLDQVKEGDKIKFIAERMNGALTVTQMEAAK